MDRMLKRDVRGYSTGFSLLERISYSFLILFACTNFLASLSIYGLPLIVLLSFGMFILAFSGYYNKISCLIVVIVLLGILWIVSLYEVSIISWLYYLETVIITLIIIWAYLTMFKYWNKIIEALIYYENILKSEPDNITAWNNIGVQFTLQRKYLMAIESFNKGLEIDPNNAVLLYNKGLVLENDDLNISKDYINRALELSPEIKTNKPQKLACKTQKMLILF